MNQVLKERVLEYIESIKAQNLPVEKTWWQHPPPVYYDTKDYATNYDKPIDTSEPAIFKKPKKEWLIISVMVVVTSVLIYLLSKKDFSFLQLLLLSVLLLLVLPRLLDNKAMIRISQDEIWLYKEDKEIPWEHVVLTHIKEVREEDLSYFFVIHYYDEEYDYFNKTEIELKGMVEPAVLSATIEAFRRSPKDGKSAA